MRRWLSCALLASLPGLASACGKDELGHHWESSLYSGEMRTQFFLMLGMIGAIFVGHVVSYLRRARR